MAYITWGGKRYRAKKGKNWDSADLAPKRRFDKRSYRTKIIDEDTRLVVACPKGSWNGRIKRCGAGMRGISVRKRRRKRARRRNYAYWIPAYAHNGRRRRRRSPSGKARRRKKWIRGGIKRPGALRRKFARWYGLKPNQKISASMYAKGYRRAKRRRDTRTMRQINMAKTLGGFRRRRKIVRMPARRRRAANPTGYSRARGTKTKVRVGGKWYTWKGLVKRYGVTSAAKTWRVSKHKVRR